MPTAVFRPYADADADVLAAMVLALYAEDPAANTVTAAKVRATVATFAAHPRKGRIVVFERDEEVVGYAIVVDYWSNEYGGDVATIDELYVVPDARGAGVAGAFVDWLAREGAPGAVALALEVTPGNARAYEWYRRLGFAPDANRHLLRRL